MSLGTYRGEERLCIAIDVGTTQSAVAFTHLVDGVEPRVNLVMRWPGQPAAAASCKIATAIRYYDDGRPLLYGAAALANDDELEDTHLARLFKLWLHPPSMRTDANLSPPPLPPNVTIQDVYADFLDFIFSHTRRYLDETTGNGSLGSLWTRFESTFALVMAVPNGWDSSQQSLLRDAVVAANILPDDFHPSRLAFVSEAESSVHFAISHAQIGSWLRRGTTFAVCDAGGSTVDTVVYRCTSAAPTLMLEEVTASECVQAGGAVVDQHAEAMVKKKMAGSKFDDPETISTIVQDFEIKAKREFDGSKDLSVVSTGTNFTDRTRNVTKGRLKLTAAEVKSVFAGPLDDISASIDRVLHRAGGRCDSLLTVGGFAESPYLREFLREKLQAKGIRQITIDEPTKKAAAEGAAFWYAKKFVIARAARRTYGIAICRRYDEELASHRERMNTIFVNAAGQTLMSGCFSQLVAKNEVVQNDASTRVSYHRVISNLPTSTDLSSFDIELLCTDDEKPGLWCRNADGELLDNFQRACTLKADLSGIQTRLMPRRRYLSKEMYYRIDFEIEVCFGQTMLCANVVWDEDGQRRRGPVSVIVNSVL